MPIDILNPNVKKSISADLEPLVLTPTLIGGIKNRYLSAFINPETGTGTYLPGNIIRFRFPSSVIDFTNSSLQFKCALGKTGGTYIRLSQNCSCVFSRVRGLFGSQEIFDIQNFNLLDSYINLYNDPSWYTGIGKVFRGTGDATYRNSQANNGQVFILNLSKTCDLLNRIIPLNLINEQFTIELTIANTVDFVETDGTNPTFSMSNLEFHYDVLQLEDEFINLLKSKITSSEGLCMPYKSWNNYINTSMTSGVTNQQTQLPFRYLGLQGIICLMRNTANLGDVTVNDKFITYLGYSNFTNSYLKINNLLLPSDKINNNLEVLEQNLQLFNKSYDSDLYIAQDWPNKFSIGFSLMQDGRGYESNQIQGIAATVSGFQLIHSVLVSSNAVNVEMQYFAQAAACIRILANGGIQFAE